jgi:hypothetical protein
MVWLANMTNVTARFHRARLMHSVIAAPGEPHFSPVLMLRS